MAGSASVRDSGRTMKRWGPTNRIGLQLIYFSCIYSRPEQSFAFGGTTKSIGACGLVLVSKKFGAAICTVVTNLDLVPMRPTITIGIEVLVPSCKIKWRLMVRRRERRLDRGRLTATQLVDKLGVSGKSHLQLLREHFIGCCQVLVGGSKLGDDVTIRSSCKRKIVQGLSNVNSSVGTVEIGA